MVLETVSENLHQFSNILHIISFLLFFNFDINLVDHFLDAEVNSHHPYIGHAYTGGLHDNFVPEEVENNLKDLGISLDEVGPILLELGGWKAGLEVKHFGEERTRSREKRRSVTFENFTSNINFNDVIHSCVFFLEHVVHVGQARASQP